MKITIVGTGAMGSVYAELFASAGHEVWAIDTWREHVEAMRATARSRAWRESSDLPCR